MTKPKTSYRLGDSFRGSNPDKLKPGIPALVTIAYSSDTAPDTAPTNYTKIFEKLVRASGNASSSSPTLNPEQVVDSKGNAISPEDNQRVILFTGRIRGEHGDVYSLKPAVEGIQASFGAHLDSITYDNNSGTLEVVVDPAPFG